MDWTGRLMEKLVAHGLVVKDVRAVLAKHPTRTYATRDPGGLRGMVWHQALSSGYGQRTVEAIARYHVSANSHLKPGGAPGFAYTLAVDGDGTVFLAQSVDVATWSHGQPRIPDANHALIGVCALGRYTYRDADGVDHPFDEPPPSQEAALVRVWLAAQDLWGWAVDAPRGGLLDHDDLGKPSCPGERLEAVHNALRARLPLPSLVSSLSLTGRARIAYQQCCLASLGLSLGPSGMDGEMGEATRGAITSFQRARGLVVDGVWGPKTEAAMVQAMRARYPVGFEPR